MVRIDEEMKQVRMLRKGSSEEEEEEEQHTEIITKMKESNIEGRRTCGGEHEIGPE